MRPIAPRPHHPLTAAPLLAATALLAAGAAVELVLNSHPDLSILGLVHFDC